jgi:hypothetical protein
MDLFSWPIPIGGTPQRDDWVLLTAFAPVLDRGFALSPGSIPPNVLGSALGVSEGAAGRHDRFGVNYGRDGQVIRTEHTNSGRTTSFQGPDRDSNLSPNYLGSRRKEHVLGMSTTCGALSADGGSVA